QLVPARVEHFLHRRRHPELELVADERAVKPLRRNANDDMRHAVEADRRPNGFWIVREPPLPELIADDDDRVRIAADVFARVKAASHNRLYAERIEVIRRDDAARYALGFLIHESERRAVDPVRDERLNRRSAPLEVLEVRPRNVSALRPFRHRAGDDEDAVLVAHQRIRAEHDTFDPAEDRGGRADSEGEAENRHTGESKIPSQKPQTEPDVLEHGPSSMRPFSG